MHSVAAFIKANHFLMIYSYYELKMVMVKINHNIITSSFAPKFIRFII